jgi:hypothetical protein
MYFPFKRHIICHLDQLSAPAMNNFQGQMSNPGCGCDPGAVDNGQSSAGRLYLHSVMQLSIGDVTDIYADCSIYYKLQHSKITHCTLYARRVSFGKSD